MKKGSRMEDRRNEIKKVKEGRIKLEGKKFGSNG